MRKLLVSCLTFIMLLTACTAGFVALRHSGKVGVTGEAAHFFVCDADTVFEFDGSSAALAVAEQNGLTHLGGNLYLAPQEIAKAIADGYGDIILSSSPNVAHTLCEAEGQNAYEYYALDLQSAFEISGGDSRITIAVLDTGIDRTADFGSAKIQNGYDAVANKNGVFADLTGHGTKICGIIASIAPACTIMPIRVANGDSMIYSADLIRGLTYAADNGAKVINMSFGGYNYSYAEQQAINYCIDRGCILIASAGNDGLTSLATSKNYPACYDGVIGVGATGEDGGICEFSQAVGADLFAPGEGVTVLTADGYITDSGTSFSAAYVSAAAALCASVNTDNRFASDEFNAVVKGFKQKTIGIGTVLQKSLYPIITGVGDGDIVYSGTKVYFNKGYATLDGEAIDDGETVVAQGSHTVVATCGDYSSSVSFRLLPTEPQYTKTASGGKVYFTFDRGIAFADSLPYTSGSVISEPGEHCFVLINDGRMQSETFYISDRNLIFGLQDGATYDTPIIVRVVGSAALDGQSVQGDIYIGAGRHTLETDDDIYSFAVLSGDLQSEKPHKSAFATNGTLLICYDCDTLGIDVSYVSEPGIYETKLPSGKITSCIFAGDDLAVITDSIISFYTSDELAKSIPEAYKTLELSSSVTAVAADGQTLYYATGSEIYAYSDEITLIATCDFDVSGLSCGGKTLVAYDTDNDDGVINIIDTELKTTTPVCLSTSLIGKNVLIYGQSILCGRSAYGFDGSLQFDLPCGAVLCIAGDVAVCKGGTFDLQSQSVIAVYDDVQNAVYANETLLLFGNTGVCVIEDTSSGFYGGYTPLTMQVVSVGGRYTFSSEITAFLQTDDGIYLSFADQNKLYLLSETLTPVATPAFKVTKLIDCGGNVCAAFDRPYLTEIGSGKTISLPSALTDAAYIGGVLYAVCGRVLVEINISEGSVTEHANISASSLATFDDKIAVGYKRRLTVYDTGFDSPLYAVATDGEIDGISVYDGYISAGGDVIKDREVIASGIGKALGVCGGYLITDNGIYDFDGMAPVSPYATAAQAIAGNVFVYKDTVAVYDFDFGDGGIGIADGGQCRGSATVEIANGYIDGNAVSGSQTITSGGEHTVYYALPLSIIRQCTFSITPELRGIRFAANKLSLGADESYTLKVIYEPSGADTTALRFNSSNPTCVSVDARGRIYTFEPGSSLITATTLDGKYSATCQITVSGAVIVFDSQSGIKIDRTNEIAYYLPLGMTVSDLSAQIKSGGDIRVVDKNGKRVSGKICTGMTLELHTNGQVADSLALAVTGDIDGDGASTASDLMRMVSMLRGSTEPSVIETYAADVTMNGQFTNADMTHLRAQLLYRTAFYGDSSAPNLSAGQAISLQTAANGDYLDVMITYTGISGFNAMTGRLTYDKSALDLTDVYCPDFRIEYRDSGRYVSFIIETEKQTAVSASACGVVLLRFDATAMTDTTTLELLGGEITLNRITYSVPDKTATVSPQNSGITAINALRDIDFDPDVPEYTAEFPISALAALIQTDGEISGNRFGDSRSIDITVTLGESKYILHCVKAASPAKDSVSTLKSLSLSGHDIGFDPYKTAYTVTLPHGSSLPIAAASAESTYAAVEINYGDNLITVICTAENGMQTTYVIYFDYEPAEESEISHVEESHYESSDEVSDAVEPQAESHVPLITALTAAALLIAAILAVSLKKRR